MQPWLVSVVVVAIVTMTSLFLGSFDSLELGAQLWSGNFLNFWRRHGDAAMSEVSGVWSQLQLPQRKC